jgi:hypothetical protein
VNRAEEAFMRRWIGAALVAAAACGPADMDGSGDGVVTASRAELEAELMRMEREFSDASGREGASAWSSRWAPNGRTYIGGDVGIGPDVVGERIAPMIEEYGDRFTWWPDTAVVAASGDLGYTLGRYAVRDTAGDTTATGHYVTVWQKQPDGSWKIAVDIGT